MKAFTNIEKSGFRKGEYVGYCNGAWNIWKCDAGWRARHQTTFASFTRKTLADISTKLTEMNKERVE